MRICSLLGLALVVASCGDGDGVSPEPLIAGNVSGSYDGQSFTPVTGFATVDDEGNAAIVLGTGQLGCGSESSSSPPRGYTAAIDVDELAPGTYGTTFVQMYRSSPSFEGVGSSQGTLTLTSVTEATIAGSISYSYTNASGRMFSLSGTFEVVHCAP